MDDGSTHRVSVAQRRERLGHGDRSVPVRTGVTTAALRDGLGQSLMARPLRQGGKAMHLDLSRPLAGSALVPSRSDAGVWWSADLAKAVFDRLAALAGLILLAPILLMVSGLIWIRDPGPVLFGHVRIGRGGAPFRCLKFRTMMCDGDQVLAAHLQANPQAAREWDETRKLKSDPRVTPLGQVLRRTSLDELPQLFNVLKGEMSLVGPRPIVAEEAAFYGAALEDYAAVRPGVTGLWQIGGRSDTSYAERVRLDQSYVRNRSFALDLKILAATVVVVLKGRGSY